MDEFVGNNVSELNGGKGFENPCLTSTEKTGGALPPTSIARAAFPPPRLNVNRVVASSFVWRGFRRAMVKRVVFSFFENIGRFGYDRRFFSRRGLSLPR